MSFVNKVKDFLGQNSGKVKDAVDKAGDTVDKKTGGKYADKVDKVQGKAKDVLDKQNGDGGSQGGQQPGQQGEQGQQGQQGGGPAS